MFVKFTQTLLQHIFRKQQHFVSLQSNKLITLILLFWIFGRVFRNTRFYHYVVTEIFINLVLTWKCLANLSVQFFPSEGTFTIFYAVISLILSRGVSYQFSRSHLKKRPKKITVDFGEGFRGYLISLVFIQICSLK